LAFSKFFSVTDKFLEIPEVFLWLFALFGGNFSLKTMISTKTAPVFFQKFLEYAMAAELGLRFCFQWSTLKNKSDVV